MLHETNSLRDRGFIEPDAWQKHLATFAKTSVNWSDPRLARITCLRLVSEPRCPVWDVSYCHGQLHDGTNVVVQLPFGQLPKRGMRRAIVRWAIQDKVYAAGLGVFDNLSTLE